MIDKTELAQWWNWCSRVDRLLLLEQEAILDLAAARPGAVDILAALERDAIQGERLAGLLEPGDAAAAARRMVARLDHISVALSDKLVAARGADKLPPFSRA